jgi:hypothetical protein
MNIVQAYSLTAGQKIDKINVLEKFYPVPFTKYIVFHPYSKPAKSYNLWEEVLKLIKPVLDKENITVLQTGAKDEKPFEGCYYTAGSTSIHQVNYLVRHAMLYLGADTFTTHLAGHHDIPIVALYAANYLECTRPYFGDKTKQILLEADRKGNKPSFSFEENPKTINSIKPEVIAQSVIRLLGLSFVYPYETTYIGPLYTQKILEIIPNGVVDTRPFVGVESAISRMDLCFNEANLFHQLQITKLTIITDQPISKDNLEVLKQLKGNIPEILYEVKDKVYDFDWLVKVQRLGIKITMFTYIEDDVVLNNIKLESSDIGIIFRKKIFKPEEIKELKGKDLTKIYYKSNKFTLSEGKIFSSLAAMEAGVSLSGFGDNLQPIINSKEFWKEVEWYYLLEKTS